MTNHSELPVLLIADDEISNLYYLEMLLGKYTSALLKAVNGREAVRICREHPEINGVLMDIKMPLMNGYEATTIIKSFRKDLPVIAVTAYAMRNDEQKGLQAGCDGYLTKPFTKEEVLDILRKHNILS